MNRPRLAVWKFSSCDGCQLSLLDCEDELLSVAERVEIAYFLEATSAVADGPYDLSLVEGSVSTPDDADRLRAIRAASTTVIAIGACATAGGIQALRNLGDAAEIAGAVYPRPELLSILATSRPVSDVIAVDLELHGCPIDRRQLLEVIGALLIGRRPDLATHSVCAECKALGHRCVLVTQAAPCLGPITRAGCGALCTGFDRACFGCFGPCEQANIPALAATLARLGIDDVVVDRLLHTYTTAASGASVGH